MSAVTLHSGRCALGSMWDVQMQHAAGQHCKWIYTLDLLPEAMADRPCTVHRLTAVPSGLDHMSQTVQGAHAGMQGTESFCCEDCLATVVAAGVRIHFHSWESPNGTTDQRGQFPELYIRAV